MSLTHGKKKKHHLSWHADIDAIEDPVQKIATIGIINNFGQTPRQLFRKPHPPRQPASYDVNGNVLPLKIHRSPELLIQSAAPIKDVGNPVVEIREFADKIVAVAGSKVLIPPNYNKYLEWNYLDFSVRLRQLDSHKVPILEIPPLFFAFFFFFSLAPVCGLGAVFFADTFFSLSLFFFFQTLAVFENLHLEHISCACFPDERTLVTGGLDTVVCIWQCKANAKIPSMKLLAPLRGHTGKVTAIAGSRAYSLVVSGSEVRCFSVCFFFDGERRCIC
jgi:WD40 repeat protein